MNAVINTSFAMADLEEASRMSRRLRQAMNETVRAFSQVASTKWIDFTVQTDGLGNIPSRLTLQTPGIMPRRCIIGRIQNLTTSGLMPSAQPFLQWAPNGEEVIVETIAGLDPNTRYTFTLEVAGE